MPLGFINFCKNRHWRKWYTWFRRWKRPQPLAGVHSAVLQSARKCTRWLREYVGWHFLLADDVCLWRRPGMSTFQPAIAWPGRSWPARSEDPRENGPAQDRAGSSRFERPGGRTMCLREWSPRSCPAGYVNGLFLTSEAKKRALRSSHAAELPGSIDASGSQAAWHAST